MKLVPAAIRLATAGALLGGAVAAAIPAHATTVPRGTTALMTCDDVVVNAKANDPVTKTGLNYTNHSIKVAGVGHPEKYAPSAAGKLETDPNGTPDWGDTDSCSGTLTTNSNPWTTAGAFAPYSPVQGTYTAPINDIVGVAGSLTGRADCNTGAPSTADSWTLHGKLTVKFGNQASVGTLNTLQSLTTGGAKIQAQVYVNSSQPTVAPVDLNGDTDTADSGETASSLVDFQGIGVKGTAEGAFFDSRQTFGPHAGPANSALVYAAEACQFNADLNGDTVIGQPTAGGLQQLVTDTDVDSDPLGVPFVGSNPAFNNSWVFSI